MQHRAHAHRATGPACKLRANRYDDIGASRRYPNSESDQHDAGMPYLQYKIHDYSIRCATGSHLHPTRYVNKNNNILRFFEYVNYKKSVGGLSEFLKFATHKHKESASSRDALSARTPNPPVGCRVERRCRTHTWADLHLQVKF